MFNGARVAGRRLDGDGLGSMDPCTELVLPNPLPVMGLASKECPFPFVECTAFLAYASRAEDALSLLSASLSGLNMRISARLRADTLDRLRLRIGVGASRASTTET